MGHDGVAKSVGAEVFFDPETGIGVAVVTNVTEWQFEGRVRQQTAELQLELFDAAEDWR